MGEDPIRILPTKLQNLSNWHIRFRICLGSKPADFVQRWVGPLGTRHESHICCHRIGHFFISICYMQLCLSKDIKISQKLPGAHAMATRYTSHRYTFKNNQFKMIREMIKKIHPNQLQKSSSFYGFCF